MKIRKTIKKIIAFSIFFGNEVSNLFFEMLLYITILTNLVMINYIFFLESGILFPYIYELTIFSMVIVMIRMMKVQCKFALKLISIIPDKKKEKGKK